MSYMDAVHLVKIRAEAPKPGVAFALENHLEDFGLAEAKSAYFA